MTTLDGQDDGHGHHHGEHRREGDGIAIDGGYQYRALTEGRPVQRYWHAAKLRLVDALLGDVSPVTALDLGCGSGVVANHLAAKGIQTTGLDANPAAVAFARRTFDRPNLAFREGLVDELDLAPASIDLIVIMEVLEHLHASQVLPLLRSARSLLAPGGRLLLTTPNYAGTWPVLEWMLDHTSLVPHMHEDQHVSRWTRRTLGSALAGAGFRTERIGTYCTVAPFISPLGRHVADRAFDLELRFDLRFGNLLYALATPRP